MKRAIIRPMQTLRQARLLARLVLAWFVLALGVAVASPIVQPQSMELICSSGGAMKLIVKNADGGADEVRGHTLDCPLCLQGQAPLSVRQQPDLVFDAPQEPVLHPVSLAHEPGRSSAPLPPRGPPFLL